LRFFSLARKTASAQAMTQGLPCCEREPLAPAVFWGQYGSSEQEKDAKGTITKGALDIRRSRLARFSGRFWCSVSRQCQIDLARASNAVSGRNPGSGRSSHLTKAIFQSAHAGTNDRCVESEWRLRRLNRACRYPSTFEDVFDLVWTHKGQAPTEQTLNQSSGEFKKGA
jgi:hypothetical protein